MPAAVPIAIGFAVDADFAGPLDQTGDAAEQRGLADGIGTDHRRDLTTPHLRGVDIPQH